MAIHHFPDPYYIIHKNVELVRIVEKTKSHYWQVQGETEEAPVPDRRVETEEKAKERNCEG